MSLFELILTSTYNRVNGGTEKMLNVFNYADASSPGTPTTNASELSEAFLFDLFPNILPIIHSDTTFTNISVRNIYTPTDFVETILASDGGYDAGEALPPYVALRFRSARPAIGVRRAQKFFGGLPEAIQSAGVTVALAPEISALAAALNNTITDTLPVSTSFIPVLLQKERYVPNPAFPTKYAYRYYGTLAEQISHMWLLPEFAPDSQLTTINSRKFGRGI